MHFWYAETDTTIYQYRYFLCVLQLIPNTDTDTGNYLITTVDDWYKDHFVGLHVVHVHWGVY